MWRKRSQLTSHANAPLPNLQLICTQPKVIPDQVLFNLSSPKIFLSDQALDCVKKYFLFFILNIPTISFTGCLWVLESWEREREKKTPVHVLQARYNFINVYHFTSYLVFALTKKSQMSQPFLTRVRGHSSPLITFQLLLSNSAISLRERWLEQHTWDS